MANMFSLLKINWKNAKTAITALEPVLNEKLKECDNKNFETYCTFFDDLLQKEKKRRGL